ncbi:HARB1 nuclease, partial [Amia calva]|nr:HARB1 nuclease [Amia calva]
MSPYISTAPQPTILSGKKPGHLKDPINIGARIVRGSLCRARVFRDRANPLAYPNDVLYERYQLSSEGIQYLCRLLGPDVTNATRRSNALTIEQTLAASPVSVCCAVRKVVLALSKLLDVFIVFPVHLSILKIKEAFYAIAGIPRVIGDLTCRLVYIILSSKHLPIFKTIKDTLGGDFLTMVLYMLYCDNFFLSFKGHFDGLLLEDRGYPCLRYLMTPYPDPPTREQIKYNVAHSNTRVRIEMTFGVIKAHFACLKGLRVCVERAFEMVAACVVFHNIATIRKERAPCQLPMPPDVVDPVTLDHPTGRAVREAIANQFFNQ